ncbi:DRTGG domain-containing protein [Streptococcaceae bacterium ESL0729]|nr:DRTGG domain-containing protein [Streptococcaceae bacterium ESL0729]
MSKHQEIIEYIEDLKVGQKVSVRGLSQKLSVSDGTAYRAIKEAERRGLVAVVDRAGTIRIATKEQKIIERLTYEEIAKISNAEVMGGREGMDREFNKFAIGAMTKEHIKKYLSVGGLLIVGDRKDIQILALKENNAVLVTGGFPIEDEVLVWADKVKVPIMRTTFDTFTVASRINRALSNELIKKDILTIADIYRENITSLNETSTVKDYNDLVKKTNSSRFVVINQHRMVVGIVTMRDVVGKASNLTIDKIMTRNPVTVFLDTTVASASQRMIFDGFELLPVVSREQTFLGLVSKIDVLRSLQESEEQNQFSHTMSDNLATLVREVQNHYTFKVDPLMMNGTGNISNGVLVEIISNIAARLMAKSKNKTILVDQLNIYFIDAVNIDDVLEIYPKVISESRREAIIDIEVYLGYKIVSKALVTVQIQ